MWNLRLYIVHRISCYFKFVPIFRTILTGTFSNNGSLALTEKITINLRTRINRVDWWACIETWTFLNVWSLSVARICKLKISSWKNKSRNFTKQTFDSIFFDIFRRKGPHFTVIIAFIFNKILFFRQVLKTYRYQNNFCWIVIFYLPNFRAPAQMKLNLVLMNFLMVAGLVVKFLARFPLAWQLQNIGIKDSWLNRFLLVILVFLNFPELKIRLKLSKLDFNTKCAKFKQSLEITNLLSLLIFKFELKFGLYIFRVVSFELIQFFILLRRRSFFFIFFENCCRQIFWFTDILSLIKGKIVL